ncbi:hypothetical protein COU48_00360 [Candidatus Nomurabacteria bacterium CG10_big_fil_rev_8_21_14_0_10_03_31_7]|uniref:Uncharacterized protein n=1 Tax=Candidatus Nomurabacteria bacterium CG10_big_fil_rev_8_21_14_0_10_03_31_7 TaxID=1974730 RepID=A0A2J0JIF7_9BACT|nr:MAG: hypothetical protein COU48_00360 [Candidatus Nomurabacteria bacterium CG10_big_fil_rev_8_21_14_0_10_03_31_7]
MDTKNLDKILSVINNINKEDDLYSRIKNAVRIYYLSMNQVFISDRVLKNVNFSDINLNSSEIIHVENAGWVLDQKYLDDVYFSAIKTHFIFNVWYILKSFDTENQYEELKDNLGILIDAVGNKFILAKTFKFNGVEKNAGELVDFVTPDFILDIAKQFVK